MFSDFWSPDAPFVEVLSLPHLIYLTFCIVAVFVFIKNREWVYRHKNDMCRGFFVKLLLQQIVLLYGWYALCTPNFWAEGLPLHLCRVASILTSVFLITKNTALMDVICYFSVYALISLFYPLNVYNFTHASGVSYMINHLITVLIPIFAVIAFDWFPSWRGFLRGAVAFTIYMPVILIANALTGGNYFYQLDRPFWHDMPAPLFAVLSYAISVGAFAVLTALVIEIRRRQFFQRIATVKD